MTGRGRVLTGLFALLALGCSACTGGGEHAAATATTSTTTIPQTVSTAVAPATAAQLAAGHWAVIPAAPLSNRLFTSVAWTGKELIVWGGGDSPSGKPDDDGAAYDPSTRTWRKLRRRRSRRAEVPPQCGRGRKSCSGAASIRSRPVA